MSAPRSCSSTYQLLSCTANIALTILIGIGRIKAVTAYVMLAVAVNLVLSIALAKPLGVTGVIIGTLVGYGITVPLYIRLVLEELGMGLEPFLRRAILPILPWAAVFAGVIGLTAILANPSSLLQSRSAAYPECSVYVAGVVRFAMTYDERKALMGFVLPARSTR